MPKTLAIDYGEKRIGLAISDDDGKYSFSRDAILSNDQKMVIEKIKELTEQESVEKIIVGWPLTLKGELNNQTNKVQLFISALGAAVKVAIEKYDERLSSQAAGRLVGEDRQGKIDSVSARLILEDYLAKQKNE
jgi:putative Holliday junction resolvase